MTRGSYECLVNGTLDNEILIKFFARCSMNKFEATKVKIAYLSST